jgi:ribosomal protein L15
MMQTQDAPTSDPRGKDEGRGRRGGEGIDGEGGREKMNGWKGWMYPI